MDDFNAIIDFLRAAKLDAPSRLISGFARAAELRGERLVSGKVLGSFADSPIGSCILAAAKSAARFPTFEGQPISFRHPFFLR